MVNEFKKESIPEHEPEKGESEDHRKAREAAEIQAYNAQRAVDVEKQAKAEEQTYAAKAGMTLEEYKLSCSDLIKEHQMLSEEKGMLRVERDNVESEKRIWANTLRAKDQELIKKDENEKKLLEEVLRLRNELGVKKEEEIKAIEEGDFYKNHVKSGTEYLMSVSKKVYSNSPELSAYLLKKVTKLNNGNLDYDAGMKIFAVCRDSLVNFAGYYQDNEKKFKDFDASEYADWLFAASARIEEIMAIADERDVAWLKKIKEYDLEIANTKSPIVISHLKIKRDEAQEIYSKHYKPEPHLLNK